MTQIENPVSLGDYVRREADGALYVAGSRISIESLIAAFRDGESPESIQEAYEVLSLEQVYGAITWCLAHPAEVDEYMRHQDQLWQKAREQSERDSGPFLARLRRAKAESQLRRSVPARETST